MKTIASPTLPLRPHVALATTTMPPAAVPPPPPPPVAKDEPDSDKTMSETDVLDDRPGR